MPVHTHGSFYKTDAGQVPLSGTVIVGNTEVNELITVPAGAVNVVHTVAFPYASIQSYCLSVAQQTAAQLLTGARSEAAVGTIVAKFNSSGSPVPSLTIAAKAPHAFGPSIAGSVNEFTANVTQVYLSNAGAVDLTLELHVLYNA